MGVVAALIFVGGCSNEYSFKQTQAGKALYGCVAGGGQLDLKGIDGSKVEVRLVKGEDDIRMHFSINSNINQAELIGAEIAGQDQTTRLLLMLKLEMMCGGELASEIMPDAYNKLRLLQRFGSR